MELLHVLTHYENYNRNFTFSNFFIRNFRNSISLLRRINSRKGGGYLFILGCFLILGIQSFTWLEIIFGKRQNGEVKKYDYFLFNILKVIFSIFYSIVLLSSLKKNTFKKFSRKYKKASISIV